MPTRAHLAVLACATLVALSTVPHAHAGHRLTLDAEILEAGYIPHDMISPYNLKKYLVAPETRGARIGRLCREVDAQFKKLGWKDSACGRVSWRAQLASRRGYPLIYASFGEGPKTTLVLGGVHPDELTPIHMAFRFARHLEANPSLTRNARVIVAPLVNPDGFLGVRKALRTNQVVDVNRNFFTVDWYKKAIKSWRKVGRARSRYFPGYFPNSEVETLFQEQLIDQHQPDKLFSIHAPLGLLDYDGPADRKFRDLSKDERAAKRLVYSVSKKTRNYRVVDYSFFPGSLGNYAGNERNLPTVTLELETTAPGKVNSYWQQFLPGLMQSVTYPFKASHHGLAANATDFFHLYMEALDTPLAERG